MKYLFSVAPLIALIPGGVAQQTGYGQCGGQGWTGPTSCTSGYYCYLFNAYYEECLPASTTISTTTTSTSISPTASYSTCNGVSTYCASTKTTYGTATDPPTITVTTTSTLHTVICPYYDCGTQTLWTTQTSTSTVIVVPP